VQAGVDYDVFYLPPIDTQYRRPMLFAGDIMAMFKDRDRPEVRAVMQYITLGQSLEVWLSKGGAFSPHNDTQIDWYKHPADTKVGDIVRTVTSFRFDGSDQMQKAVGQGTFWKGVTDYVTGSIKTLDEALEAMQKGGIP
jgi:alpha-glucoside transport system substrate-binding protein